MKHDTPEFIADVLPILKRTVEHRLAAFSADEELMDLFGCSGLTGFYDLVDSLAFSVDSAAEVTEDNVSILSDQVHDLIQEDEDEEDEEDEETCTVCDEVMDDSGDNWDDLCPECADVVSSYMDVHNVSRDIAIEAIRTTED